MLKYSVKCVYDGRCSITEPQTEEAESAMAPKAHCVMNLQANASPTHAEGRGDLVAVTRLALGRALEQMRQSDLGWIHPCPKEDGWTMAPDTLRLLTSVITNLRPQHVLEFGSGLSTCVLTHECTRLELPCRVSSVDHDPEFGNAMATGVPQQPDGSDLVSLQIAPLVAREFGGKFVPVFLIERSRLACSDRVDLIVIDGPPAVLGGREGVLYQAMDFARPGTLVLLDDADRPEERMVLKNWQDNLGDSVEITQPPGFTRGLGVLIIRNPVPTAELLAHRLRRTRQEIEMLVQIDETIVVAGDDWWRSEVAAGRRNLPFSEHNGQYYGPPLDDETAIAGLERLRKTGAAFFALGWPVFWWCNYYSGFYQHLRSKFFCVSKNDRVVLFDLRKRASSC